MVAYITGLHTPKAQLISHASTIITSRFTQDLHPGTAQSKISVFEKAKIPVASSPYHLPELLKKCLKKNRASK